MKLKNNNMEKDFLEKRYEAGFNLRTNISKDVSDIRPFVGLMKEFADYAIEYGKEVLPYVDRMQQCLYDKELIPFTVQNLKDRNKLVGLPHDNAYNFLLYVLLALRRVDEDWQWVEEEHRYEKGMERR